MTRRTAEVLEQVPLYTLTTLDDGKQEKLLLVVQLPGIQTASELEVRIQEAKVSVRAAGRYNLELPLNVKVKTTAERLNFVKKKSVLKAELLVIGELKSKGRPRAKSSTATPSGAAAYEGKPEAEGAAVDSRHSVHDSFLAEAVRLRDAQKAGRARSPPPDTAAIANGSRGAKADGSGGGKAPAPVTPTPAVPRRGTVSDKGDGQVRQAPRSPSVAPYGNGLSQSARSTSSASGSQTPGHASAQDMVLGPIVTPAAWRVGQGQKRARSPDSYAAEGQRSTDREINEQHAASHASHINGMARDHEDEAQLSSPTESDDDNESDDDQDGASMPSLMSEDEEVDDGKGAAQGAAERPTVSYMNAELRIANREAAEECHSRATAALSRGDIDTAIRLLTKATTLDPVNTAFKRALKEAVEEQQEAVEEQRRGSRTHQKAAAEKSTSESHDQPQPSASRKGTAPPSSQKKGNRGGKAAPAPKPAAAGTEAPRPAPQPPPRPSSPAPQAARMFVSLRWTAAWRRVSHNWGTLPEVAPVLADILGLQSLAYWLHGVCLSPGSMPYMVLWLVSWITLLLAVVSALTLLCLLLPLAIIVLRDASSWVVIFCFSLVSWLCIPLLSWLLVPLHICLKLAVCTFWRPTWFTAIPMSYLISVSDFDILWPFPVMWFVTGGRWWFLFGTPLTFALSLFTRIPFIVSNIWLVGVQFCYVYLPWWAATVIALVGLVALLLLFLPLSRGGSTKAAKLSSDVPEGASGEVARILGASDYYQVLEVERSADDAAVRRAKRVKVLLVHPDKLTGNAAIGAAEAFHRLTEAHDTLADTRLRQKYDRELAEAERAEEARRQYEESPEEVAGLHMPCPRCAQTYNSPDASHPAIPTSRPLHAARYCRQHGTYHEAHSGDIWLESSGLWGFKAYLCTDLCVLDITEWVNCNKRNFSDRYNGLPKDMHTPLTTYEPRGQRSQPRDQSAGQQAGSNRKGKKKGNRNRGRH